MQKLNPLWSRHISERLNHRFRVSVGFQHYSKRLTWVRSNSMVYPKYEELLIMEHFRTTCIKSTHL